MANGKGRGWAPLRAQTPQATELAQFLRHLVDYHGFTLRRLQSAVPYGKSTISDNLSGRVPPLAFVEAVVTAVVTEPRKRAVDLERARALWRAADKPPPAATAPAVAQPGSSLVAVIKTTSDELATVYGRNMALEREKATSHHLVLLLLRLVATLNDKVEALSAAPDAEAELTAVNEQLLQAQQELERARQARADAEALTARAQRQSLALQEELAQLRAATPPATASTAMGAVTELPPELHDDFFFADVDRALRTAEGFLEEGAQQRERLAEDMGAALPDPAQVDESWRVLALVLGRALGCVLMMVGSGVHYAVSTWVTTSQTALGLTDLLVLVGVVLLVDPWEIIWNTLRPWARRFISNWPRERVVWSLTASDALTRVLRVLWGAAASTATVLSLATVFWWPVWILVATVPAALGTMSYAVLGRSKMIIEIVAPAFTSIAGLARQPLLAADASARRHGAPRER